MDGQENRGNSVGGHDERMEKIMGGIREEGEQGEEAQEERNERGMSR